MQWPIILMEGYMVIMDLVQERVNRYFKFKENDFSMKRQKRRGNIMALLDPVMLLI